MPAQPLNSASRSIPKATYVPLTVAADRNATGGALPKFSYTARLNLQPGEVALARTAVARAGAAIPSAVVEDGDLLATLKRFEGTPLPSELPAPSDFAPVRPEHLLAFGQAIQATRQQTLSRLTLEKAPLDQVTAARAALNTATVANRSFQVAGPVSPVGMLNLERLEMTPAGIQCGGLIATIPLAPGETTSVVQKEWSVTTKEFTSIVSDSLENYSETGVTENTELAQSTTSQVAHSNQFNINASASGGIGFVSGSSATSFTSQDQNSQSAADSSKHAVSTTRKASSRVKQEHKVTISNTTVTGTQETTTRTITNPSLTDPMRIDYFSLIRDWRVRLYRYGLRLTYDIAIPEPGATLREIYAKLAQLQMRSGGAFTFPWKHSDITADTHPGDSEPYYLILADQYQVDVPPPPDNGTVTPYSVYNPGQSPFILASIVVPEGCWITNAVFSILADGNPSPPPYVEVDGSGLYVNAPGSHLSAGPIDLATDLNSHFLLHQTGSQIVKVVLGNAASSETHLTVTTAPTDTAMAQWRSQVWTALYNAAQTTFYAEQQALNAQIGPLQDAINGVDTLTLRREENDEIMKSLLRWLLGPTFDFMPQGVINIVNDLAVEEGGILAQTPNVQPLDDPLQYGLAFADANIRLSASALSTVAQYGEQIKFINEAIEWENLVYFLYSYFWDLPASWDFIRQIRHPDATRQAFLRAGSTRVVVTVRKGYERAWVSFVETGKLGQLLDSDNPYMTIAAEIEAYDNTNYPGIPPANPAGSAQEQQAMAGTSSNDMVGPSAGPVTITVGSSAGFIAGYAAVIDTYTAGSDSSGQPRNRQEAQLITAVPDDGMHLILQRLENAHDGTATAFPIVQPGESGILIAEWHEYTPTSGTDIAITSDLTTIV